MTGLGNGPLEADVKIAEGKRVATRIVRTLLGRFGLALQRVSTDPAGVYRGGTASLLASMLESLGKTLHLFDTFAGRPRTELGRDLHREGDFAQTSVQQVRAFLSNQKNVELYPGAFPGTALYLEHESF